MSRRVCENPACGGPIGCRPQAKHCSRPCYEAHRRLRLRAQAEAARLAWAAQLERVRADAARLRPNRPTGRIAA